MSEAEKTSKPSFFKNLKSEFKRCTWPKKEELVKQSALVIAVSVALGVVISGIDWVIRLGLQALNIVS
ncbi:MAG: preprotein translocase subunit SecE [Lachnospiraceae bacterium]|nr:preprotein translocase subunit SecE [Lachnospiraceae bacterium]